MGRTADERLTVQQVDLPEAFLDKAAIYAQEEKMPYDTAKAILSGASRPPYGTPRK